MCNDPSPEKYLAQSMLPLNARVMDFFDTMEEIHHQSTMGNLYNSDTIFKAAYNHEKFYRLVVLRGN